MKFTSLERPGARVRSLQEVRRSSPSRTLSELPDVPLKLYFRIGEVADLVGVKTHILRYWEHERLLVRPQKSKTGQRVYRREDIELLRKIRVLIYEQGLTIAGVRRALRLQGLEPVDAESPAAPAVDHVETLLKVRQKIIALLEKLDA
jgi:DNA-binding transcriptional MerR regulator